MPNCLYYVNSERSQYKTNPMGDKDITSRRILKNLLRSFADRLLGLGAAEIELLETQPA